MRDLVSEQYDFKGTCFERPPQAAGTPTKTPADWSLTFADDGDLPADHYDALTARDQYITGQQRHAPHLQRNNLSRRGRKSRARDPNNQPV